MSNSKFNIDYLRKYVHGELAASEMYTIECAAHEDEMLMDIIQGLEYELKHKLSTPKEQLKNAVQERAKKPTTHIKKLVPFKSISIAASLIFALSIGLIFYYYRQQGNQSETIIALHNKNESLSEDNLPLTTDSITPTHQNSEEQHIVKQNNFKKEKNIDLTKETGQIHTLETIPEAVNIAVTKKIADSIFTILVPEEPILAYRPLALNKENTAIADQQLILPEIKSKVTKPINMQSASQQRAKLNTLHIDAKTQNMLNEVLDRQTREELNNQTIAANTNRKNESFDTSSSTAYAVRKENLDIATATKNSTLQEGNILIYGAENKTMLSAPKKGLKSYKDKLTHEISKSVADSFYFKLKMKLDSNGKPYNIEFLTSSHPQLNTQIELYLHNAEKWNIGKDADHIIFEINK